MSAGLQNQSSVDTSSRGDVLDWTHHRGLSQTKRNLTVPVKNKLWYNKQNLPLPFKGVSIPDIIYEIALLDQMRRSLFITARIARRQSMLSNQ